MRTSVESVLLNDLSSKFFILITCLTSIEYLPPGKCD